MRSKRSTEAESPPASAPWWRWALLALYLAVVWATGPWALVALLGLALRPVRRFVGPGRPWRSGILLVLITGLVATPLVLLRAGELAIPPGAGALVTPSYVGRPDVAAAYPARPLAQDPHLAPQGRNSMHNDAAASDAYTWRGPEGDDVQVRTAWYGVRECATLAFARDGRIVALCGDLAGPSLHLIDPHTLADTASLTLPKRRPSKTSRLQDLCGGAYMYLDEADRAVVATTDQRIVQIPTAHTPLRIQRAWSVRRDVPAGDCLIAVLPGWNGDIWFVTRHGRVGVLDPPTGRSRSLALPAGEGIANSFAVDEGGAYVVSDHALYKLQEAPGLRPQIVWRTAYDRGIRQKPGQLSRGSGTTPTLLAGGRIAITDNADPRMHVQVYDARTGRLTCSVPVFRPGRSDTENSLAAAGDLVLAENNYGYTGPWSTLLGLTTEPGVAAVDTRSCRLAWTAAVTAPTSVPKVSLGSGLAYVYAKPGRLSGVSAWYLTALDLRTGRVVFARRVGIGAMFNNHYGEIAIGPDSAAYVPTLTGLVRLADRNPRAERG